MSSTTHRTLSLIQIVAALSGQMLLSLSPQPAMALLGLALVCALVDGWYFLAPLEQNWWPPVALGLIGLTMWREPRGWFFLAWALIELGTGLRAGGLIRSYRRAREKEAARRQRLADLGFEPGPDDDADLDGHERPGP